MATQLGSQISGAQQALPQSPFNSISSAMEESQKLAYRIEELANRLCGSVPTKDASGTACQAVSNGLLDEYQQRADATLERVFSAMQAIDRIDRSLP